ncbi:glucosaminidase domain-containing protein [Hydrotalea sp.]|uniref:glucosaminidase domain-containing protein n=1 Tax=Hydrotalea sp. TaxID=2881279 RepID=UPI00260A4627|nr:glucosaminidase domain-containing protein [Hydrotalea sp.]
MKLLSCLFLFVGLQTAVAQSDNTLAYINQYKDIAMQEMTRTGVPASITLAQGILESASGESDLCKKSNNHFGIKCKTDWTGDRVFHDDDFKHECFRSYPNAAASFQDHSNFLKTRPYYQSLFTLNPTDYEGWAYGLKKAGYATEKNYAQRLIELINKYNLNEYTEIALAKEKNQQSDVALQNTTPVQSTATATINTTSVPESETTAAKAAMQPIPTVDNTNNTSITESETLYPEGIFTINHLKVLYAQKGTALLSIANQHQINLARLLEYNDLEDEDILQTSQLIFLEKKMKKGDKDFHIVKNAETLYTICQQEGIRMENLLQFNKLQKNMQPLPGEKIYLRFAAPASPKYTTIASENTNTTSR